MRRKGLLLNRFGGVGGAAGRIPLAAGEQKRFCPLLGLRPKGGAARHPYSIVLNMAAPHTWERFGCQTIDSILLPGIRQPHTFVSKQKYAKVAFSAWLLAANEIAGDFDAAVQLVW